MTRERCVLGIDTASRLGSIALAVDGVVVASEPLLPGAHSSGLSAAGEKLLVEHGITWKDLAGVAVSEGPGSFTGLRIGLAWAKGICLGSGIRLALVSAHEAAAYRHRGEGAFIATVLPGEKGEVHAALWKTGRTPIIVWGPRPVPESELSKAVLGDGRGETLVIPAPDLNAQVMERIRSLFAVPPEPSLSQAAAVAELGDAKLLADEAADLATSAPAYGRAPNARKPAP
jgi:tRNA threonylcarbamoyladenosine biosynthesis protein TsaB